MSYINKEYWEKFYKNNTSLNDASTFSEYILNQNPVITPYSKMTGFFNCDDSVVGDIFRRKGALP